MMQVLALDTPGSGQGPSDSQGQLPGDDDPAALAALQASHQLLVDLNSYISSEDFLATIERVQIKAGEEFSAKLNSVDDDEQLEEGHHVSDPEWVVLKRATVDADFEVIENRDIIEAMAEFIAQSVAKMNETRSMPSRTVQYLLSSIFGDIRNKGMLAQFWGWGSFLYTAYGWSSYTLNVYRHPALLKLILQTILSAAKWAIGRQ